MPLVSANGVQIHLTDTGAAPGLPDAPVVVFGHGLLFSGWMFQAQMEALRPSYRCVAIDWRGQGKTPPTDDGYDMDTLYADAAAVIEGLDVGPVHYAGLSMGGFVGMRLAARRPDLLRSLVLLDTSAGPEDPEKVSRYRLLATVYGLIGMRPLRSQVNPIMFARGSLASAAFKPVVDEWYSQLGSQDRRGVKKAIRGVTDRLPIVDELGSVATPTLVVVGSDDVATPVAKAETIAAAIAGSRLEIVQGAGHSSTLEKPEAVTELLQKFLADAS